jgi:hypothetical protein
VEPPEDAVRVLDHALTLCRPGGLVLDLTSVPPPASLESQGAVIGELDQAAFLERAAITEEAVDRAVADGRLAEEASVAFDVLKHFDSGPDVLADLAERSATRLPEALRPQLAAVDAPVVERTRSLLRRLRVRG